MSRTTPKAKSDVARALGARLRIEREAQGLNLHDLAQGAGVSINTIRWHEAGSRMLRADDLVSIAVLLNMDAQALMVPHDADREADGTMRLALGRRMQAERALAGKLQHQVVLGTGVAVHDLAAHEAGKRSLRADQLVSIALALKIEPSKLMAVDIGSVPLNP